MYEPSHTWPEPPASPGGWQVGPWQPSGRWAQVLQWSIVGSILAVAGQLATVVGGFSLFELMEAGTATDATLQRWLDQVTLISNAASAVAFVASIGLAGWLFRSVSNAAALGRGAGRYSPWVAAATCFIPVINAFLPPIVLHDIRTRVVPGATRASPLPVVGWWLISAGSGALASIATVMGRQVESWDDVRRAYLVVCIALVAGLVGHLILLVLVRGTERHAMELVRERPARPPMAVAQPV